MDALLLEEGTVEGIVLTIDMEGTQIGHVFKLGLFTVKHYLHYIQEAFPVRMKQIHFFNVVPFIDKILSIVRPFMHQSLWNILSLDATADDMFEYIPADIFPSDYGGAALSIEDLHGNYTTYNKILSTLYKDQSIIYFFVSEISYKNLLKYQNRFFEAERCKLANESLRIKKRWF